MTTAQRLHIEAKPDVPIACDMTGAGDTAAERFAEYGRLFAHALIDRQRTDDGVVFTLACSPGSPRAASRSRPLRRATSGWVRPSRAHGAG